MSQAPTGIRSEAKRSHGIGARRTVLLTGIALVTLAMTGCDRTRPNYLAIDLTGADFGRALALQDPDGRTRTLEEFRGRYVMLFFGFTQCPDVCPTTLTRAVQVRRLLGEEADKLQVLLVSVDPDRDTPEILRQYIGAFDPGFIALRGDAQATEAVAREFKVHYARVPSADSYTMDHTALSYIIDPEGRLRLAIRHEQTPGEVVQDLRTLMKASR